MSTLGLYRPGDSALHRAPAGRKLLALVLAGAGSIFVRSPLVVVVLVGALGALYVWARIPASVVWRLARGLLWFVVPLLIFQVIFVGWARAAVILGTLLWLIFAANLVTLTTRTSDLVDVVVAICDRIPGLNAERIGVALSLGIRAVPLVAELGQRIREAQLARGQSVSARSFAVPLIVLALRRADQMGDALAARGFDD